MNFKAPQQVICLENKYWIGLNRPASLGTNGPQKDKVYEVTEVITYTDGVTLYLCLEGFEEYAFNSKYFAPLIDDSELYEEINDILNLIEA